MADKRVLIIADDPLVRAGLSALLADQPGCVVAGRVASSEDLDAALDVYRPDVLLWDAGWNTEAALAALGQLGETAPPSAVLLPDAQATSGAWMAGARGLLPRDVEPDRLVAALVALARGLIVISPGLEFALMPRSRPPASHPWPAPSESDLVEELTQRELEVLRLLAEGLPNKTIASRLGISDHTVKFHVNAIMAKLGVASRTEAVVRATRLGIILL